MRVLVVLFVSLLLGFESLNRLWDVASKEEIKKIELSAPVVDIELSRDGRLLLTAFGNKVAFWNTDTYVNIYR